MKNNQRATAMLEQDQIEVNKRVGNSRSLKLPYSIKAFVSEED